MIPHEQIFLLMIEHDLFLLPTLGKSFGHVIWEALISACTILISDRTPWKNLEEKGIRWDFPLDQIERFEEVVQKCVAMDEATHCKWRENFIKFGLQYAKMNKLFYKINTSFFNH